MKIPQAIPITPLQSKGARFHLGLTQANVIQESGLPGHKIKGFESGRLVPDMKFLEDLAVYYEGKGIDLSTVKEGEGLTPAAAAAVAPPPGAGTMQSFTGMALRIAVPFDQVDAFLERMETNDERIDAILKEPAKAGFLSDYDDSTEALQRELFGLMAVNYLYFRGLQGRSLIGASAKTSERKTQLDVFRAWAENANLEPLMPFEPPEGEVVADTEEEEGE